MSVHFNDSNQGFKILCYNSQEERLEVSHAREIDPCNRGILIMLWSNTVIHFNSYWKEVNLRSFSKIFQLTSNVIQHVGASPVPVIRLQLVIKKEWCRYIGFR